MSKYMVLDLETQTHSKFKRKGNPFLDENYIVMRGWKVEGDAQCSSEYFECKEEVTPLHIPDDVDVLVAFNAKFELLYELRFSYDNLQAFFKRGGRIWCGQYCEYLLNAQQQKFHMNSLDQIAPIYGGRVKIDGIKALWDAGVQTSDIDRDLLLDYLIGTEEEGRNSGDIGNTEIIYLGQIKAAEELGMLTAIKLRMDGLCATSEMEFRGLKIDIDRARGDLRKRLAEQAQADEELSQYIKDMPEGLTFNWNSPVHKSALIFGGAVKYQKQDTYVDPNTGELARKQGTRDEWLLTTGHTTTENPDDPGRNPDNYVKYLSGKRAGEYKTKKVKFPGELKVKYQDFFHKFHGYVIPLDEWKSSLTDGLGGPVYSTSGEVLDTITATSGDVPFIVALGEANRLNKEIGTYYVKTDPKTGEKKGMLTCVQPWDHMVHHKLNHTSTVTSRLSSSDPR